jgi:hypothetical protein
LPTHSGRSARVAPNPASGQARPRLLLTSRRQSTSLIVAADRRARGFRNHRSSGVPRNGEGRRQWHLISPRRLVWRPEDAASELTVRPRRLTPHLMHALKWATYSTSKVKHVSMDHGLRRGDRRLLRRNEVGPLKRYRPSRIRMFAYTKEGPCIAQGLIEKPETSRQP